MQLNSASIACSMHRNLDKARYILVTVLERLQKPRAKPQTSCCISVGQVMQILLSRMCKANSKQLHSDSWTGQFFTQARDSVIIGQWTSMARPHAPSKKPWTSGRMDPRWSKMIQATRLIRYGFNTPGCPGAGAKLKVSTVKVAHRATSSGYHVLCPNWRTVAW